MVFVNIVYIGLVKRNKMKLSLLYENYKKPELNDPFHEYSFDLL